MKKQFKVYLSIFKRRTTIFFYGMVGQDIRQSQRERRQYRIKKAKSIYDISSMD